MSADQGDVRIIMTADANKVLAEWQKMLRAATQFNAQLLKMTGATKDSEKALEGVGKKGEAAFDGLAKQAAAVVTRLASVAVAIRTIRQEIDDFHEAGKHNMDEQKALAGAQLDLLMAIEKEPGGLDRAAIVARIDQFIAKTGRNPVSAYTAFAKALSTKGLLSQEQAVSTVEMFDDAPWINMKDDAFEAYSTAIMSIRRADPKASPKAIFGAMAETNLKAATHDPGKFATTAGGTITGLMEQFGYTFEKAAALFATFTIEGQDPEGRRAATAAFRYAFQLQDATKRIKGLDKGDAQIEWLKKPEQERIRKRMAGAFTEKANNSSEDFTGEMRMLPTIRGMVDPQSKAFREFEQFAKDIPKLHGGGAEQFVDKLAKDAMEIPLQQRAADAAEVEGIVNGARLRDQTAGIAKGISKYEELLAAQRKSYLHRAYTYFDLKTADWFDSWRQGSHYWTALEVSDRKKYAEFQLKNANAGITNLTETEKTNLREQIDLLTQILEAIKRARAAEAPPPRNAPAPPKKPPGQRGN